MWCCPLTSLCPSHFSSIFQLNCYHLHLFSWGWYISDLLVFEFRLTEKIHIVPFSSLSTLSPYHIWVNLQDFVQWHQMLLHFHTLVCFEDGQRNKIHNQEKDITFKKETLKTESQKTELMSITLRMKSGLHWCRPREFFYQMSGPMHLGCI